MRVITQQQLGGPEVLTIVDASEPRPLPTEVLVRVKAIGLNPLEARLRAASSRCWGSRRSCSAGM